MARLQPPGPLHVVGSAARGERRNVGTDLPIGKGENTRSDIDVLIGHSSKQNFPGADSNYGFGDGFDVNFGTPNPNVGPHITFSPR